MSATAGGPAASEDKVIEGTWNMPAGPLLLEKKPGAAAPVDARPGRVMRPASPLDLLAPSEAPPRSAESRLVTSPNVGAVAREQYRRLAGTLHRAQAARDVRTVMVTSAVPGEGKTLTAVNLALTLSESYGRRVLLADADLRLPAAHDTLGAALAPGLSDILLRGRPVSLAGVQGRLSFLPAGEPCADPMAALSSDTMRRVIEEARETFDWVVVDTPPVGVLTDAALLASLVDAVVLVVAARRTPVGLVRHAVDAVGRDRIFGVVLNRAGHGATEVGYEYYHGYGSQRTGVESGK